MAIAWADRTLVDEDLGERDLVEADLRGARLEGINLAALALRGVYPDREQAVYLARCHGAIVD
jgi:uncharacterized protein YjbI with pentapeptide repeats